MSKQPQIKDEDEACKVLRDYLTRQNRPYNANDIFMNLHQTIGKTLVGRALSKMAENNEVNERVFGKQKIYFPIQANYPTMSKEELSAMDQELAELKNESQSLQQECDKISNELSAVLATPETEEAENLVKALTENVSKKQVKLDTLRSDGQCATHADKERINAKFNSAMKLWRQRKRMATDILDQILESYPKPKRALFGDIGLETDEDCSVDIKSFS